MIYCGLLSLLLAEYAANKKCSAVLLCSADSIYPDPGAWRAHNKPSPIQLYQYCIYNSNSFMANSLLVFIVEKRDGQKKQKNKHPGYCEYSFRVCEYPVYANFENPPISFLRFNRRQPFFLYVRKMIVYFRML